MGDPLILEEQGQESAAALVELLNTGQTSLILRQGLELLLGRKETLPSDIDLNALLSRWSEQLPVHPIRVDILHGLASISLVSGDFETAQGAAETVFEEFPGSEKIDSATQILAWVNWNQGLYRSAAVWFERLRGSIEDPIRKAQLSAKVGDSYFLAGDYELAASSYAQALQDRTAIEDLWPTLQYQRILSLLRGGAIDLATQAIEDNAALWRSSDYVLRWQLEWNVAVQLSQEGQRSEAQARLSKMLQDASLPDSLEMRFRWLNVRLLFDLGEYAPVVEQVEQYLSENDTASSLSREVRAELLLLRERARIRSGVGFESVVQALESIRTAYSETSAAPETLWVASRILAREGRLLDAEEAMNRLASEYEGSPWSRMALFESANLAEAREDYQRAANRLEAFVQESPNDPLAFTARLNQADLLRKTGSFDEARVLLQGVLQEFPDHPERYLGEMIRSDLLAASSEKARLGDAVSAYLRLLDLAGVPFDLQLEAHYKLGKVYERLNDSDAAVKAWLEGVILFEEAAESELATGPYWVSRSLLEIARISEESQNVEAAKAALERLISLGLPGKAAANSALRRLRSPLVNLNAT
ncbi:MAG: tetratricopeptide repeat protein, partial [Verrucomicrobiota bacterium]